MISAFSEKNSIFMLVYVFKCVKVSEKIFQCVSEENSSTQQDFNFNEYR